MNKKILIPIIIGVVLIVVIASVFMWWQNKRTELDECFSDSDCGVGYWCYEGPCGIPMPGEDNCQRNFCIKTCDEDKDCEDSEPCDFISLFQGGDVSVGLRKGCVRPDVPY